MGEGTYHNGLPHGEWTIWDRFGTKMALVGYEAGERDGVVLLYYTSGVDSRYSGNLKVEGQQVASEWTGEVRSYYPDGQLRIIRSYQDGEIQYAQAFTPSGEEIETEGAMDAARYQDRIDQDLLRIIDRSLIDAAIYGQHIN